MSIVDIVIIATVIVSLLVGLYRGFIREVLSLLSWMVALWVAYRFAEVGAVFLESFIDQPAVRVVMSFAAIFVLCLLALSVLSYLIHRSMAFSAVAGVDRHLGMLFGILRGVIIVALMIMVATFMDFASQPWWKDSLLAGYFDPVVSLIRDLLPPEIAQYV